jgi:hypothetical protein
LQETALHSLQIKLKILHDYLKQNCITKKRKMQIPNKISHAREKIWGYRETKNADNARGNKSAILMTLLTTTMVLQKTWAILGSKNRLQNTIIHSTTP